MWICQDGFATEDSPEMINGSGFAGGDLLERIYRNGFAGADPQVGIGVDLPEWICQGEFTGGVAGVDRREWICRRGFAGVDLQEWIRWCGSAGVAGVSLTGMELLEWI